MGIHNSSKTRVVPVFDWLMDADGTGTTWLPQLLQLGSRAAGRLDARAIGPLASGHERWWGDHERSLYAPVGLLRWLVRNGVKPQSEAQWGRGDETIRKRHLLVEQDPETIAVALDLLQRGVVSRGWHVLEGPSRPDAYLKTESTIVVVEGKRTEREATTTTTWMTRRSQILRHMDAAWEVRGHRRVLGLMIVEGDGGWDATEPSPFWLAEAGRQVASPLFDDSLPHRDPATRAELANSFLGVTTWQRVCAQFRIPWPPPGKP